MTPSGIIGLCSALYLSAVLCVAVSVNENRAWRRILRESARRWAKFAGICIAIGVVIELIG